MARPIILTFTIEDGDGKLSKMNVPLASDTPLDEMQYVADTLAGVLIDMVTGRVVDVGFSVPLVLTSAWYDDIDNAVHNDADVEEGGIFVWESSEGYRMSYRVATFDEAFVIPYTDTIDQSATPVAAWIDFHTDGIDTVGAGGALTGASVARIVTSHDEPIASLKSALESFIKSRR